MITTIQFRTLDDLFSFYNHHLFEGQLAECIVNLSRLKGAGGFFAPERWKSMDKKITDKKYVHEISINPDSMIETDIVWHHSVLVHEMCHLWQYDFGKYSRNGYHNREWANKMIEVGLMPSHTGQEGGRMTGQTMCHYVIKGGKFEQAFNLLKEDDLKVLELKFLPTIPVEMNNPKKEREQEGEGEEEGGQEEKQEKKSGKRIKYTCNCGNNVWGKSGLHLHCIDCDSDYEENT